MDSFDIVVAAAVGHGNVIQVLGEQRRLKKGYQLLHILTGLHEQARAWNWTQVEAKLDAAYKHIGGANPGTGYDFHSGTHPAQDALRYLAEDGREASSSEIQQAFQDIGLLRSVEDAEAQRVADEYQQAY